jgi:hypothetical protein
MSIHPSLVSTKINGVFAADEVFYGTLDPFMHTTWLGYTILDSVDPDVSIEFHYNYEEGGVPESGAYHDEVRERTTMLVWHTDWIKHDTQAWVSSAIGACFGIPAFNISDDYSDGTSVRPSGLRGDTHASNHCFLECSYPSTYGFINFRGIEVDHNGDGAFVCKYDMEVVYGRNSAEVYPAYWFNPNAKGADDVSLYL